MQEADITDVTAKTEVQAAVAQVAKAPEPTDLFSLFAVDKERAIKGADLKLAGTTFKVARLRSPKYEAARNDLMVKTAEKFGQTDSEERQAYFDTEHRKIVAKLILIGWDTLKYRKALHSYSEEMALEILQHDDFYDRVIFFAGTIDNYLLVDEEDTKN